MTPISPLVGDETRTITRARWRPTPVQAALAACIGSGAALRLVGLLFCLQGSP